MAKINIRFLLLRRHLLGQILVRVVDGLDRFLECLARLVQSLNCQLLVD